MIENVTLTASHFRSEGASPPPTRAVVHLADWISNGLWCVRRTNVLNSHCINPADFRDNFKRPKVEVFNGDGRSTDYNSVLWLAVMLCGNAIPKGLVLSQLDPSKARPYQVTRWTLNHKVKGEDSYRRLRLIVEPGITVDEYADYWSFALESVIDAVGLEPGDMLTGVELSNKGVFLVTSDQSRCFLGSYVIGNGNTDVELQTLPFLT